MNSITEYVIAFVEAYYPNDYEFSKADICDLVWNRLRLEYANDATDLFMASMESVDWDVVEASFFPASVDVWWNVTIEHRGQTEIHFESREEYEMYKDDPQMFLASYINHDYASESYEEDVSDISVREA